MKKLLSKKAFTLVEVIIATAIMGLLIAAIMALFGPVKGIVKGLDEDVMTNNVTDTINNFMYERMKNASAYNIGLFSTSDCLKKKNEDTSVAARAEKMIGEESATATNRTYCLMIRYDNDDSDGNGKGYRIYDFGLVTDGDILAGQMAEYTKYKLLGDEFYNNKNLKFTFETVGASDPGDFRKWCKLGVTAYEQDGMVSVDTREQMFKLVNMGKNSIVGSDPALKTTGYDTDKSIVILYRISDYTSYIPESE